MITVYTDASFDPKRRICAWAYVIISEDEKALVQTGHYKNCTNISGEILAVVEALERCKAFDDSIKVYSDYIYISKEVRKNKEARWRKLSKKTPAWSALWTCMNDYPSCPVVCYINHKKNPAHKYAYAALKKARKVHK